MSEFHEAALSTPTAEPPPRLAPTLVALGLSVPALLAVAGATLFAAMAVAGVDPSQPGAMGAWVAELILTPVGVVISLLPTQVALVGGSLLLALLSPQATAARLGLRGAGVPPTVLAILALGTVGIAVPLDFLLPAIFGEPSAHLRMMTKMFTQTGAVAVVVIYLHGALLAGLSEELFFRGYVQTRLLERWPPAAAIAVPALTFSALHFDPMHIAATIPSGLWLGWITHRTGSCRAAIVCHIANNVFAITAARALPDSGGNIADGGPVLIAIAALCVVAAGASVVILLRRPVQRRRNDPR